MHNNIPEVPFAASLCLLKLTDNVYIYKDNTVNYQ
jgi:hypothetical protein